jgi:hypothetical protein
MPPDGSVATEAEVIGWRYRCKSTASHGRCWETTIRDLVTREQSDGYRTRCAGPLVARIIELHNRPPNHQPASASPSARIARRKPPKLMGSWRHGTCTSVQLRKPVYPEADPNAPCGTGSAWRRRERRARRGRFALDSPRLRARVAQATTTAPCAQREPIRSRREQHTERNRDQRSASNRSRALNAPTKPQRARQMRHIAGRIPRLESSLQSCDFRAEGLDEHSRDY